MTEDFLGEGADLAHVEPEAVELAGESHQPAAEQTTEQTARAAPAGIGRAVDGLLSPVDLAEKIRDRPFGKFLLQESEHMADRGFCDTGLDSDRRRDPGNQFFHFRLQKPSGAFSTNSAGKVLPAHRDKCKAHRRRSGFLAIAALRSGALAVSSCAMTDEDRLLAANAAFYRAFGARDLEAMDMLWAPEQVSCVHPGWPALLTRAAVLASYRDIFRNPHQEAILASDESCLLEGDDGRVFCVENVGGALLLATNWFRRIGDSWRMLHHQASPLAVEQKRREPKHSFH